MQWGVNFASVRRLRFTVTGVGIEPTTYGLKVRCSTD